MNQIALMITASLLVGLASAALFWFGTDLVLKLRIIVGHWMTVRRAKAEAAKLAKAEAEAKEKEE
ncbi:MAG: hypothetical protein GC168_02685 [Candidatus Hydrogenedens sp.]|nr:hypothetical protein [Candidatus Hydrogenedens sp.]